MNDWIEWVWSAEKPYPETLDTMVIARTRDGWEDWSPINVGYWHGTNGLELSNWFPNNSDSTIVAYRIAEND